MSLSGQNPYDNPQGIFHSVACKTEESVFLPVTLAGGVERDAANAKSKQVFLVLVSELTGLCLLVRRPLALSSWALKVMEIFLPTEFCRV